MSVTTVVSKTMCKVPVFIGQQYISLYAKIHCFIYFSNFTNNDRLVCSYTSMNGRSGLTDEVHFSQVSLQADFCYCCCCYCYDDVDFSRVEIYFDI